VIDDGSDVRPVPLIANWYAAGDKPTFAASATPVQPEARVSVGGTDALNSSPTQ
jgi:hypothetical protein